MTKAEKYAEYLKSDAWTTKRRAALERDSYTCQHPGCESRRNLQVHHRRYPRVLGEEPLGWLTTLCHDHHQKHHDAPVIRDGQEFTLTRLPYANRWTMLREHRKRKRRFGAGR